MKVTEEDLAQMEADGATIRRNPPNRPREPDPEPVAEVPPPLMPDPTSVQPSAEGEAMRMLVAQNSEAMLALGEALRNRKVHDGWDAEVIRDDKVKGEYKPITHVKLRAVAG